MATILAHITVHEGREAEFEALARDLHASSHADEDHLRAYGYWRAAEPRRYYTLLAFDDYLGFLAHQTSRHHEAAGPPLRDCIESMTLEWVDPIDGASTLAPSDPQDLPADASPLMTKYAAMIPVHVADWWKERREGSPA
jgi:quinol monooxygenase YgiN